MSSPLFVILRVRAKSIVQIPSITAASGEVLCHSHIDSLFAGTSENNNTMGSEDETMSKLEMYFFPFLGGGHMIPMIDTARVFASHRVKSTVLAVPSEAGVISKTINRDQDTLGLDIHLHVLAASSSSFNFGDMTALPSTDTSALRLPFEELLSSHPPDCLVLDTFHRWASDVVTDLSVPYIIFNGSGCFPRCVNHALDLHAPQDKVESDDEPFIVPGLPHRIELTKSQVPQFHRKENKGFPPKRLHKPPTGNIGFLINSFQELEPDYIEYYKKHIDPRVWLVGPVSLINNSTSDKSTRGQSSAISESICLDFLATKPPNSVIYISFGSSARLPFLQFAEIAHALENSRHFFIWAIGKHSGDPTPKPDSSLLPDGFEDRISDSGQGLIIRGWAPQLLILENEAVGAFVTHCGWNSMMEGLCAGLATATWPLSAEQFNNERLVTEVLNVGVKVGSKEWRGHDDVERSVIGRETVSAAVEMVMGDGDEAMERRRRAAEVRVVARRALEKGGSSYEGAEELIEHLRRMPKGETKQSS
ncbi:hypothetical protein Droror1_Dr00005814 [Drosera rotundifolia]